MLTQNYCCLAKEKRNIHIIFHKVEVIVSLLSFSITGPVVTPVQQYRYNQEWGEGGHKPITIDKKNMIRTVQLFHSMEWPVES